MIPEERVFVTKSRTNENIHAVCELCAQESSDCTCSNCICGHCVENGCECLTRESAQVVAPKEVELDELVSKASTLNLGSLFRQAKKSGLIAATTQAYT